MTTPSASAGTGATPSTPPPFTAESPGSRGGAWLPLLAAAAAGPAAGVGIVLLSKALAGRAGLPGAVVGYIAATAVVLGGVAIVVARRWLPPRTGRGIGVLALLAGVGIVAAGAIAVVPALLTGVLLAGALGGPLIQAARVVNRPRAFRIAMTVGVLVGTALAAAGTRYPGVALLATGTVALLAGLGLALRDPAPSAPPDSVSTPGSGATAEPGVLSPSSGDSVPVDAVAPPDSGVAEPAAATPAASVAVGAAVPEAEPGWARIVRAAAGFAVGATVLPALHLLLFRWTVLDADQPRYLAVALIPAVLVASAAGGTRRVAAAPLLVLAAGGPVLVATAPGAWQATVGIALTVTAAVRAWAVTSADRLDERSNHLLPLLIPAISAGVGLAAVAGLRQVWGDGAALTLAAMPVLAAAAFVTRPGAVSRAETAAPVTHTGDATRPGTVPTELSLEGGA
ncbi:hypothetical protein [Nocardia sp. alder85J]|uniref:hypothetical protein n=1 Tax=Nocardia sp. alder85J TaxID=2862949 RepID=UPI001CD5923D|nr:hypothetical protein [Nocardia sp. alder85J]MCX4096864.1 hypothetical protein [Nocardia sp. alder85J]